MSSSAPKLSTTLQTMARGAISDANIKTQILHLYRRVQKSVPHLLKVYAIDEPVSQIRKNIKKEFVRHGTGPIDPRASKMLLFKAQAELDESLAQWKTRTQILRYVYETEYQPHLARSKMHVAQSKVKDPILAEFFN